MPAIKLDKFGGMLPAWSDLLLPDGQAAFSRNAYLYSGSLIGWRKPKVLRALLNSAARMVYRVPTISQATAGAFLVFVTNVNEGDTVKVGDETYRFTATVTNSYDVLLGATATDSAAHLLAALLDTGTAGTTYGTATVPNPFIDQTAGVCIQSTTGLGVTLTLKSPDFGEAFNSTAVAESTSHARVTWLSDTVSLSDTTTTFTGGANQTFDSTITGIANAWLEFEDRETDVIRSPVVDDKFGRYYFASPSLPPRYNTYDRIQAGQDPWLLGVPAPGCAPGVTVTGGGNLAQLGNVTSFTTSQDTPGGNVIFLIKIKPLGAMVLNDVTFVPEATSSTAVFQAVLYDDLTGVPSQLLNTGEFVVGTTTGAAATSAFTNPTGLLPNVTYWVGIFSDTAMPVLNADDNTGTGVKALSTFSNGAPPFAPAMTTGQPNWNMWADLTTASVLAARAYVYTWITEYSEEGPPSPSTLVNGWSNGTWTIDLFSPPPDDMGVNRNIKTIRLYRTVVGTGGLASYFFVADVPVTQAQYVDVTDDAIVALNLTLPSITWFPPPDNLEGIISLPNGITVGFKGNEIWFSEPYQPHAWPPGYVLTTEFPIVGLGATGQTVVACTSSRPYTALGVNPATMALTKAALVAPCHSRGSIISTDTGVYYASTVGLIQVTDGGVVANTTEKWITRERWQALTPQKNLHAIMLASSYFAYGVVEGDDTDVAQDGFCIELSTDSDSFTIWPQPGGHRRGFGLLTAPNTLDIDGLSTDPWTSTGLMIQNGSVLYYDFTDQAPEIMPYKWTSRAFQAPAKKSMSAMKVFFSVPPNTPTQNATRNEAATTDASWNTLATDQYGIIRVYADGVLVTTREIRKSGELLRILGDFKADIWQWEIEGRVLINNVQLAPTVKELAQV